MFKEEIGNEYIVIQEGTSEGTQIKYKRIISGIKR